VSTASNNSNDAMAQELLETEPRQRVEAPADPSGPKTMAALLESKDSKVKAMEERVTELKVAEDAGDLAWMEYTSWFCSGNLFQRRLRDKVNPIFWGSAYFEHSRFVKQLPALTTEMSPSTLGILFRRGDRYQVVLYNERHPHHTKRRKDSVRGEELLTFTRDGVQDVREDYAATFRDLSKAKDKAHRRG
jgi:hypothetical protein